MLSSVAGIFGSGGQANYAAGNTYQDALARYRVRSGQKAVSLDLGTMLSEGYLANAPETMDRLAKTDGLQPISQEALFALLEHYCDPSADSGHQLILGLGIPADLGAKGIQQPWWSEQPLFRALHQIPGDEHAEAPAESKDEKAIEIGHAFRSVKDVEQLRSLAVEALIKRLNRIMPGTVGGEREERSTKLKAPLHSLGIDSLVAVELRNWFSKDMGADIATFEILGGMGLEKLAAALVARSTLVLRN